MEVQTKKWTLTGALKGVIDVFKKQTDIAFRILNLLHNILFKIIYSISIVPGGLEVRS